MSKSTSFLTRALDPPRYGYELHGKLVIPRHREIIREFLSRLNIFHSKKNWLPLLGWTFTLLPAIPLVYFLVFAFQWKLLVAGFLYSMVLMGSHGTVWLHRYSTHRAFKFRNSFFRFICKNLVIKIVPEEIYVVSHHVHHHLSEKPGDPYNPTAGWLYCFLADVNHQTIHKNLSVEDYARVSRMLDHTGIKINSYAQYQKWGSVCHPARTLAHYLLNWGFWFGAFYLLGGLGFASAIFGFAGVWAIGVRTFNYDGHGGGKDKRRDGIDFAREDRSINQVWPGYVAGEWHNNHHLYPNGARSGFLKYQLDLPWLFIRFYRAIGGITTIRDYRENFFQDHYLPYLKQKNAPMISLEVVPGGLDFDRIEAAILKEVMPDNDLERFTSQA